MNRDDIIRMAREAGCASEDASDLLTLQNLERFAKLVAATEREACARVCDARYMGDNNREDMEARRCAAAIRARGEEVACVQKREWIDLTDDEIWKVIEEQSSIMGWKVPPTRQVALAVQAKLKELNHK